VVLKINDEVEVEIEVEVEFEKSVRFLAEFMILEGPTSA
jgi:hypothetical protein